MSPVAAPRRAVVALFVALTTVWAAAAVADDASSGTAGTYGAPFLRIPVGARLMSSPDVLLGMSPDASASFSNPAFLAALDRTELFISTATWLEDLSFSAASGTFRLTDNLVAGLGTTFLYSGGLNGYDASLNVVTETDYHDAAFTASLAGRYGGLSLGASATYIREYVLPAHGNGYSFSLGAGYRRGPNFVHASALNIGGTVRFDAVSYPIDGEYLVGAGRLFRTALGSFVAGAQLRVSEENRVEIGADYRAGRHVTLRAAVPDVTGGSPDVSGGVGVSWGAMRLDYAYTPVEYFSATHTVSLVFGFGAQAAPTTRPTADDGTAPADMAPVIAPSQIQAPPANGYVIVAGTYATLAEARGAATKLEDAGILTEVEPRAGGSYRVVVGRYTSRSAAERALALYRSRGDRFELVTD